MTKMIIEIVNLSVSISLATLLQTHHNISFLLSSLGTRIPHAALTLLGNIEESLGLSPVEHETS